MLLIKMALRNLTRHKRRVLATAIILAIGITIYLTLDSMMLGLTQMSFNNLINLETGDIQVVNKEYWEEREELPLDDLIVWNDDLEEMASSVAALVPQLKFSAKLNNGIDELPIVGYGIESDRAVKVFTTEEYLIEGSYLTGTGHEAVLGKELADLMDFKLGDYLTLLVKTKEGTFNTIDAEIVGLLNTGNPTVNSNFVYLPLNIVQEALNLEGKVSQVILKLKEDDKVNEVITKLNNKLRAENDELKAYSWRDLAGSIIAMMKAQNMETGVMMSMILMIAAIGIVNTVILSSLERTEEIGMMKALGFKKKEIILIFMAEAAGIGLVGGVIGLLVSAGGVYFLVTKGINLTTLAGGETFGIPIMGQFYGLWNLEHFALIFVFGVILCSLASIPPAYWAARKDPVDALQYK